MSGRTFLEVIPIALLLAAVSSRALSQECANGTSCEAARTVVRDLARIVAPSGIQESYKTRIGGIDQWITARGQDRANPVLLFIHGGPASPLTPTLWQFQRPIEEYFTVVTWDQRAAGKTYREADPETIADTLRIARYVEDVLEVAEHVRRRHGKDKLILMGHSWGTILGMHAALQRPELFHAYVGIGQVINTRINERLSFEYGMQQAKANGNKEALAEMQAIAPYPGDEPITRERIIIARKWAQQVVMLMGRHDYTTPSQPTADWLEEIRAPFKQGVWFERSSHMIPWEEPGKLLVSLLRHVRPLAESGD